MRSLILLVAVAACGDEPSGFPVNPGGGGGTGGTGQLDAAVSDPDALGTTITGRVCLASDARNPLVCAGSGAGQLGVTLGSESAVTAADGTFTVQRPASTEGLVWRVSGAGIEPSAMPFGASHTIPVLGAELYELMVTTTQVPVSNGSGAILLRVTRAGAPVAEAIVNNVVPVPDGEIYYDGAALDQWETDATGSYGMVWIPSIGTSAGATLTVMQTTVQVPVFAGTITFASAELP